MDDKLPTKRILSVVLPDNAEDDTERKSLPDNDEDSYEYDIQLILPKRAKISQIRFCSYLEDVVLRWSDNEWIKHLRISKELLFHLAGEYEKTDSFKSLQSDVIAPVKTLVIFLWFAGHECASFRDIANRFDISINALHVVIRRAINFLSVDMAKQAIKWPSVAEMEAESRYHVSHCGLVGIIGQI